LNNEKKNMTARGHSAKNNAFQKTYQIQKGNKPTTKKRMKQGGGGGAHTGRIKKELARNQNYKK